MQFNRSIYLRQMQGVFLGFAHGWLNFAVHSRGHLTMLQFSFDLRLTTVEQCPCLALSAWKTEAKTKISKAKSPPTQCTHHAHNLSSSHQCTLRKQHHPAPITLQTSHRITLLWKHSFSEWRVKRSKWNHPWLSEHLQNNCLLLQNDGLSSKKNTSLATSLSFLQWLRDSVAFC